jgi:hypothetical protein
LKLEAMTFVSKRGVGGTMFAAYLDDLLQILKDKYSDKKFLLVLDNCRIHKTTAVNLVL